MEIIKQVLPKYNLYLVVNLSKPVPFLDMEYCVSLLILSSKIFTGLLLADLFTHPGERQVSPSLLFTHKQSGRILPWLLTVHLLPVRNLSKFNLKRVFLFVCFYLNLYYWFIETNPQPKRNEEKHWNCAQSRPAPAGTVCWGVSALFPTAMILVPVTGSRPRPLLQRLPAQEEVLYHHCLEEGNARSWLHWKPSVQYRTSVRLG